MTGMIRGRGGLASGVALALVLAVTASCSTTSTTTPATPSGASAEGLALEDGQRALAAGNYAEAIRRFQAVVGNASLAPQANVGLGDAYLAQAEANGDASSFNSAAQYFQAAVTLADRRNDAVEADARLKRAEALMGHFEASSGSAAGTASLASAITEYTAALAIEQSAEGQFGLARAYRARRSPGDDALAAAALQAGVNLGPAEGSVSELVALAEIQAEALGALPAAESADTALQTLLTATRTDPGSAEAWVALGERYFDRAVTLNVADFSQFGSADLSQARQAFARVATPGSGAGGAPLAEAHYYLAVIDSRGSPSDSALTDAIGHAESAIQTGGADFRFRREACLLTIMRGRVATSDANDDEGAALTRRLTDQCQVNTNLPEGRLLSGMSILRRAQYVNGSAETTLFTQARAELEQGVASLRSASPQARRLQWPGMRESVPVEDFLRFADGVIVEQCVNDLPDSPPTPTGSLSNQQIREIFRQFRAFACDV